MVRARCAQGAPGPRPASGPRCLVLGIVGNSATVLQRERTPDSTGSSRRDRCPKEHKIRVLAREKHPTVHREGNAAVIVPSGDLDLATAPLLERELEALASVPLVIVDLRSVESIDSTGLNALLRGREQAMNSGQEFAVVKGPEQVQRLLSVTGVADRLTIVDAPEQLLTDGHV